MNIPKSNNEKAEQVGIQLLHDATAGTILLLAAIEEFDARLRTMSKFSDHASIYTVRSMLKEELEDRGLAIPLSMGR